MDTFVVRVWAPGDGAGAGAEVRGVVCHVATGTETPFRRGEDLLALLRRVAEHQAPAGGPPVGRNASERRLR